MAWPDSIATALSHAVVQSTAALVLLLGVAPVRAALLTLWLSLSVTLLCIYMTNELVSGRLPDQLTCELAGPLLAPSCMQVVSAASPAGCGRWRHQDCAGAVCEDLQSVAGGHQGLVHQPPAVVGPSHSRLLCLPQSGVLVILTA